MGLFFLSTNALSFMPWLKYGGYIRATVNDTISTIKIQTLCLYYQHHDTLSLCCANSVCFIAQFPLGCVCLTVASERDIVLEVSEHIKPEVKADLLEWVCTYSQED